jgi:murein DD-endopeptidase MepM/ murein hydrolase activator NlpD
VESDGLWEVKIDHPASFMGTRYLVRSVYQGLSDLTVDIGQKVRRGDEIGRSEFLTFGAVLHQGVGFDQHVRLPVFWRTRAGRVECYNPAKRSSSNFPNESVYSGNTVSFIYPASCGPD